mmetsp:Transcript_46629/g.105389  ORF Transcript_46629/g.105389 Transcript_46629/m.105389 type:complete len:278 (-) Transcript_46629:405-1238(-)
MGSRSSKSWLRLSSGRRAPRVSNRASSAAAFSRNTSAYLSTRFSFFSWSLLTTLAKSSPDAPPVSPVSASVSFPPPPPPSEAAAASVSSSLGFVGSLAPLEPWRRRRSEAAPFLSDFESATLRASRERSASLSSDSRCFLAHRSSASATFSWVSGLSPAVARRRQLSMARLERRPLAAPAPSKASVNTSPTASKRSLRRTTLRLYDSALGRGGGGPWEGSSSPKSAPRRPPPLRSDFSGVSISLMMINATMATTAGTEMSMKRLTKYWKSSPLTTVW